MELKELDALLLEVIRDQGGESWGFPIHREAERRRSANKRHWWKITMIGTGTFYISLHRMEGAGFLDAYWESAPDAVDYNLWERLGRPESPHIRRRLYRITDEGTAALEHYVPKVKHQRGFLGIFRSTLTAS